MPILQVWKLLLWIMGLDAKYGWKDKLGLKSGIPWLGQDRNQHKNKVPHFNCSYNVVDRRYVVKCRSRWSLYYHWLFVLISSFQQRDGYINVLGGMRRRMVRRYPGRPKGLCVWLVRLFCVKENSFQIQPNSFLCNDGASQESETRIFLLGGYPATFKKWLWFLNCGTF